MDLQNFDIDGNGAVDQTSIDVDGDAQPDAWRIDKTGDGVLDEVALDIDGDNRADVWAVDNNQNGVADGLAFDQDLDGVPETYVFDVNENGVLDANEAPDAPAWGAFPGATGGDPVVELVTENITTIAMIPDIYR